MSRAWQIELKFPDHTIKSFVYSDTGTDIKQRFKNEQVQVKVLGEIDDPVAGTKATPKNKEKFI